MSSDPTTREHLRHWLQRVHVQLLAVAAMAGTFLASGPAIAPADPHMPLSFLVTADHGQLTHFVLIVLGLAVLMGVLLVHARPEAALLAVAAGASGVALHSQPFRSLLQYQMLQLEPLYSRLIVEVWMLAGVVLAAWVLLMLVRLCIGSLAPAWLWQDPLREGTGGGASAMLLTGGRGRSRLLTPADPDASDRAPGGQVSLGVQRAIVCLVLGAAIAGALLLILLKSDARGQVIFAIVASFFLAAIVAHQAAPGPFALVAVLMPPLVATGFYLLGGRTLLPATPQGWTQVKAYAMALPIDWMTFGVGASLLGFWLSGRMIESRIAAVENEAATAQPPVIMMTEPDAAAGENERMEQTMRVGVQLFTLRDFCKTMPDIVQTLKKVRQIGYTAVQVSGVGPVDPKELAKAIQDEGLAVAGTHMGWERFLNETDAVIETHKIWNCTHAAIGALPPTYYTPQGLQQFLDELAIVAPKLNAQGIDFSFHNHNIEFIKFDGRLMLELLYERSDPRHLKAELDTYWVQAGGGSPQEWVAKLPGRQPLLHFKDYAMAPGEWQPRFAPVGEGNLDWPAIIQAARASSVEWVLVEQDNCYGMDPFEAVAISYRNLRALGLS